MTGMGERAAVLQRGKTASLSDTRSPAAPAHTGRSPHADAAKPRSPKRSLVECAATGRVTLCGCM